MITVVIYETLLGCFLPPYQCRGLVSCFSDVFQSMNLSGELIMELSILVLLWPQGALKGVNTLLETFAALQDWA